MFTHEEFVIIAQIGCEEEWSWEEVARTTSIEEARQYVLLDNCRVFHNNKEITKELI